MHSHTVPKKHLSVLTLLATVTFYSIVRLATACLLTQFEVGLKSM